MTEEELDRFAEKVTIAMARALQQARSVSDSEHFDHHQWLRIKIMRDRARMEFWEKMRQHAIVWGILSVITFALYGGYLVVHDTWGVIWARIRGGPG